MPRKSKSTQETATGLGIQSTEQTPDNAQQNGNHEPALTRSRRTNPSVRKVTFSPVAYHTLVSMVANYNYLQTEGVAGKRLEDVFTVALAIAHGEELLETLSTGNTTKRGDFICSLKKTVALFALSVLEWAEKDVDNSTDWVRVAVTWPVADIQESLYGAFPELLPVQLEVPYDTTDATGDTDAGIQPETEGENHETGFEPGDNESS